MTFARKLSASLLSFHPPYVAWVATLVLALIRLLTPATWPQVYCLLPLALGSWLNFLVFWMFEFVEWRRRRAWRRRCERANR